MTMAKPLLTLILISTLSLSFHLPALATREFDFFTLALQWAPTLCRKTTECCPINACCSSRSLAKFTIFGFNPTYNDGTAPAFCGCSFNATKIEDILPQLNVNWPSLSCNGVPLCNGLTTNMFAHAWEKRGSCSSPVLNDEGSYFNMALDVFNIYDVTDILYNAGISPSDTLKYQSSDIVIAIRKAVRGWPVLQCEDNYVKQVHLCFTKDFVPQDCLTNGVESSNGCPEYVSLPSGSPHAMTRTANQETFIRLVIV